MSRRWRKIYKRIKNWIIYKIVKFGLRWLRSVNRYTAIHFMQHLALIGFYLVRSERNKTIKHLSMVYGKQKNQGEIYQMAKAVFLNLGRNMADAFRLPKFNAENIDQFVTAQGLEHLDKALERGKGVLALTGHIGNWELMGAYLAMKGYTVNVVGAPIYDPRLDELVVSNRQQSGLKYIARGSATREILRAIRRNEIVGLLIDQDTRRVDGVFVDFLGKQAYTPVGPVILSMKTGASIVPMAIHIQKDLTHRVQIEPEIVLDNTNNQQQDSIHNTQKCSDAIAKFIKRYPLQWVWMHQRWKTQPQSVAR